MSKFNLYEFQNIAFNYVIIISYILYFVIALGLFSNAPHYLETLQYWIKIYISIFLIYRFNFFNKVKFSELDRKVAFSAGLFLLSTTIFGQILDLYLQDARTLIQYYN
jgi:hypothetical protein